jgi:tetratricopeptide (TPR) repeat protein
MGEVYEATDLELGDRVALKAIRPDIARDADAMERFRREIQLSRRVTHPNVCRVFDVCHHEKDGTTATFLTMEFLSGETLGRRMKARARLSVDEALPIVEQIAAGLDAAHRAGIVHRDFKPDNVILTESEGGPRAVVTDFGLARRSSLTGDTVTGTGAILGTPAYMAPEQLEGGPITAATDVYALGCVLYEMVTGVRPFQGDTPMFTAVQRLKEPPLPPRRRFKELSPVWNDVILRCLERDPGKRFASTNDVVAALVARAESSRSKAIGFAALAIAAVLGVGVGLVTLSKSRSEPGVSPAVSDREVRRSVAILGFKNLSGREDSAWLSTALSEMLGTELAAGEELRIVSGENVARVKQDLSLPASDTFAPDTLARIRAQLGCDLVMLGSYTALPGGGQVRLDLRLQDARAGQTVMSLAASGMEAELFDLVSSIGNQIREKVGLRGRSDAEAAAVRASLPMSVEAARLFSEGLDKLRGYEYASARDVLQEAVAIEPDFALSHWALAEAWWELGYRARAQEQAGRAVELSEGLSREERLKIEARQAAFSDNKKDRERAVELYRTLWSFFPDELDYGLALAEAQEPKPGLETLAGLKQMSSPSSSDIQIDLLEAEQGIELSDYEVASSAARRAVEKAERSGSRVLLAWALSAEARVLNYGDDPDAPLESVKRAQEIYAELGDRRAVAEAMLDEAHLLRRKDTSAARARFRESLRLLRDTGAEPQVARALGTFADLSVRDGDASDAESMQLEALEIFRRIGSQRDVAYQLVSLGKHRVFQGDLIGARRYFQESADVLLALDDVDEATREPLFWMAEIDFELGELENAKTLFRNALEVDQRLGVHVSTGSDHSSLGDVLAEQGRIDDALAQYREALGLLSLVPDHWGMVAAHMSIADLLVLKGERQAARDQLLEAAALEKGKGEPVLEARILVREAAVLRRLGDVDSATALVAQAMEIARPALLESKRDVGFTSVSTWKNTVPSRRRCSSIVRRSSAPASGTAKSTPGGTGRKWPTCCERRDSWRNPTPSTRSLSRALKKRSRVAISSIR